MKRLILLVAVTAAGLTLPGAAHAAKPTQSTESVSVLSGVLTVTGGAATADAVRLASTWTGVIVSDTTDLSGKLGSGCSALTSTSAFCAGASSASVQTLHLNDSIVNNSRLAATLDAGAGDDTVTGGTPAETLRGGDGHDVIVAGGGADTVDAGADDDQVDVRDGVADTVDCGLGNDSVTADPGDVLTSCEVQTIITVTGPSGTSQADAPDTPAGGQDPSDELSAPERLHPSTVVGPVKAHLTAGASLQVRSNGKAPFLLGCSADAPSACTGVVFIDPVTSSKRARKEAKGASVRAFMARRGRYGASPFRVRPGAESTLQVKLTKLALRALGRPRGRRAQAARRGRKVRAVVTIAPKNTRAQRVKIVLKG